MEVKISPKVYLTYPSYLKKRSIFKEVYLKYSSMSAGQNISRSIHNLWSNSPVVRAQVYQTIVTRLKTLRWPKSYISLSPCEGESTKYQRFLGNCCLKVSLQCDSFRKLNSIHKVVHCDKYNYRINKYLRNQLNYKLSNSRYFYI